MTPRSMIARLAVRKNFGITPLVLRGFLNSEKLRSIGLAVCGLAAALLAAPLVFADDQAGDGLDCDANRG